MELSAYRLELGVTQIVRDRELLSQKPGALGGSLAKQANRACAANTSQASRYTALDNAGLFHW